MVRVITKQYAQSMERIKTAISVPTCVQGACIVDRNLFYDAFDFEEDLVPPDWTTLKVCHYAPGNASVM